MDNTEVQVRSAMKSDRHRLANLIHFEEHVHRHLDWKPTLDWIGTSPYLLAERRGNLAAALACPPDPPEVAWLRLFAVAASNSADGLWQVLWMEAQRQLSELGIRQAYVLALQDWFVGLLTRLSFPHVQDVVVLAREVQSIDRVQIDKPLHVRTMRSGDLARVCELDNQAFGLEWRNSLDALRLALEQATIATVAEEGNRVVGYQISTSSPLGGHLARLAVDPADQGHGIGTTLVHAMIESFERLGIKRVTVNTQMDNQASLAIYRKCGFQLTGEIYPVFRLSI